MANLTRCEKGHFYDTDKHRTCPYCNQPTDVGATIPVQQHKLFEGNGKAGEDSGETIGFYNDMPTKPVVGWLVAIAGSEIGKDFRLCSGRNYIGRGRDMDVVLEGDQKVSRNRHAVILFDPRSQKTLCQPGDSKELFYRNDCVVTETVELQQGDVLTIGDSQLMFVPFCGALHSWDKTE